MNTFIKPTPESDKNKQGLKLLEKIFEPEGEVSEKLSLTLLNYIFESKAAGICVLDENGHILKANRTYQDLSGYSEGELEKLTFLDVTPVADQDLCKRKMEQLFSGKRASVNFQKRLLTKSQKLRWIEVNCTTISVEKTYALCFLTDIHESKLAEEKLRMSEEQLHQAQEIAKIGSWWVDLRTDKVNWSRGMYDIMELSYDYQLEFDAIASLIHPEDRPLFKEKLFCNKENVKDLEIRHLTPSGVKYFLINSRLDYEDGEPVRYHGTSQDVSERLFADKRLQLVQKTANLGWWESNLLTEDEDLWSDSMYDLLELDREATRCSFDTYLSTLHPEDREKIMNAFQDPVLMKNGWHNRETRHRKADGTYKYLLSSGQLIWDGDRPVRMIGTMMDISPAKEIQIQLEEAQKIAKLGWWEVNLRTGESVWSDSMFELYELDKKTTIPGAEAYFKTVHPDDLEAAMAGMNDPVIIQNGWHNEEMRHVMPDGSCKYFLVSGSPVMDGNRPVKLMGTNMDITTLKETQLKLEQAQEIAKLGWWEINLLTGETTWSDAIYDIVGVDKSQGPLPFDKYAEHVHPEDRPWLFQDPLDLKSGWTNKELRYKRKSGGITYVLTNGRVEFQGDVPVRMIGTNMDITALKEAQLKLEQAQRIAKLGWWEFDLTGQNHWYSVEHLEIFELSGPDEIKSYEDFLSFVHPEDVHLAVDAYRNAAERKGWSNLVHRIKRKNGGYKYITSNATLEYLNDKPVRLFGSVFDVTDFKEIEHELGKNLVNLETMVNAMENIVFIIDDQLVFREVFCNTPDRLSINPMTLKGKPVKAMIENYHFEEYLPLVVFERALSGEVLAPVIYKYGTEGQHRWWEAKFNCFIGQEGKKWVALILNDVTSRKNAEEELVRGVQKEKELSEMRSQFVAMASHQFRTPLTVIKSNMQLLELAEIDHPVIQKVTRRLESEVDRLVFLMEDIMAMGKVQSNAVQASFKPVSVASLIKQIKLRVESQQADGRTLSLKVSGKEKLLNLDAQFIEHAVLNLIDNAFKYSAGAANPEVELQYREDKLRISVIDWGIGVPENDQSKVFTSFQRGSNVTHIRGTGLGLAVSREFIRLNQGTIFLNTRRKSGTEFCIDLPFN